MRYRMAFVLIALALLLVCSLIRAEAQKDAPPQDEHPRTVTRVFDIRHLLARVPDFALDASPHSAGLLSSAAQQSVGGPATPPPGKMDAQPNFGGQGTQQDAASPRQEQVDFITKLILDTIDHDSWRDNGGSVGAIREYNGTLIVTQSEANLKSVDELLRQISDQQGTMARVTCDWLLLPPGDLARLVKSDGPEQALQTVDAAALAKLPNGSRRFHSDVLCFSGQKVYVVSGRERSVVAASHAVVSTDVAGYDPTVASVSGGLALQVQPTIDWDHKMAVVTLHSAFGDPEQPGPPLFVGGATTRPSATAGTGIIQPVNTLVQEMRTTVRLPLGQSVLVGGMTLEPTAKAQDSLQLALIIKVTGWR